MNENITIQKIGYIEKGTGKHQSNMVYGMGGVSPTLSYVDYKEPLKILIKTEKK